MARSSHFDYLNCLITCLGALLLAAAAMSGVAACLAYLRPEKAIDWKALALMSVGLLAITLLIFSVAWHRIKNS